MTGPSENVGGEREEGTGDQSSPGVRSPGDGRKTRFREVGSVPCFGGGRGSFQLGLAELEGLVGHLGGDVSRKLAMCVGSWGDVGGRKGPEQSQRGVETTLCV